jgi:hypothetical protein
MFWILLISLLLNIILGFFLYSLWKRFIIAAQIIFIFEDTFPELIQLHNKSISAANVILDNEFFVLTPEAGEKFHVFIESISQAKNSTLRVIQLLQEVNSNINKTIEVKIKNTGKEENE